jgi:hypothetical protein
MAKYYVVHGSVQALPSQVASDGTTVDNVVGIGGTVELTAKQAESLVADGFLADEKKFAALKKQAEGALEGGDSLDELDKPVRNLAAFLKANPAPKQAEQPKK